MYTKTFWQSICLAITAITVGIYLLLTTVRRNGRPVWRMLNGIQLTEAIVDAIFELVQNTEPEPTPSPKPRQTKPPTQQSRSDYLRKRRAYEYAYKRTMENLRRSGTDVSKYGAHLA